MRTVLLGTDLMYNANGDIVPIEINTNITMDLFPVEDQDNIFDFSQLSKLMIENGLIKVIYIGALKVFNDKLKTHCLENNITYEYFNLLKGVTIPFIEDSDDTLIIRSAYDGSAVVDTEYCKNKVNFMNLIKSQLFSSQFAYRNPDGSGIINHITTIPDNGNHPNFILKAIYPNYDKKSFPKLYKVSTLAELETLFENVTDVTYLTQFHYNPDHLYESHIKVIRSFNLLFPPNLESISIGQYSKLTTRCVDELSEFDVNTFEVREEDRSKYVTLGMSINDPKLLDSDMVEMADGTFKTALDLQVGDMVKTIVIPNPNNQNLSNPCTDYSIDYNTFLTGTTYSSNKVLNKIRVNKLTDYVLISFTDGTTWEDTTHSSYLEIGRAHV